MKRLLVAAVALLAVAPLHASISSAFGLDAFNRAVSATTQGNAVFSPFSFEIDSVIFSEAVDTLSRAKFAESMGVLNGLELTYQPLYEMLTVTCGTNLQFKSARGFCLPNERRALASYRKWLQTSFAAEAFSASMQKGADCWFRARMDGAMEDFKLRDDSAAQQFYSFYDLVSLQFFWKDPFPTNNTKTIKFHVDERKSVSLAAMRDVRPGIVCNRRRYAALRIQLSPDALFYALLPNPGQSVRDMRAELTSVTIHDFINGFKSVTDLDVTPGRVDVTIPKMDVVFESDLKLPFEYFRFPTKNLERVDPALRPRYLRQRVRFQLDEKGVGDRQVSETAAERVVKTQGDVMPFVLDRPFVFFVYHEPTATIPVAGQFMGR